MERIVVYISKNIDVEYKKFLLQNISSEKFEILFENEKDKIKDYMELIKKIQLKKISRIIVVDEFGSLPFMIMSKNKGIVVAQISDYHSARMTIQHNNSNVLSLGFNIIAKENMINIINSYLNAHFEAGRHMVRINMLENLLEDE